MKLLSLIYTSLFISSAIAASFPYTGNGSDNCDFNNQALNKELYNCLSLSIQGTVTIDPSVINSITIRVQHDAHIYGSLNGNGQSGFNGNNTSVAGKGGGHSSKTGPFALSEGQTGDDASSFAGPFGGGGGGGAAHNPNFPPTSGNAPTLIGAINHDATLGASGSSFYGDESLFELQFLGGAGGGTGSSGLLVDGSPSQGGSGGAGGSAIRIIAGGIIEIHPGASISVNGGNGGNGGTYGGGGGGGAGGSLFLQARGEIINNGTISSLGGEKGTGGTGSGDGGKASMGRIRLDDFDGIIAGSGSVTPSPYTFAFIEGENFKGKMSCATIEFPEKNSNENFFILLSFIFGLLPFALLAKKKALD